MVECEREHHFRFLSIHIRKMVKTLWCGGWAELGVADWIHHTYEHICRELLYGGNGLQNVNVGMYIWLNFMVILLFFTFLFSSCRKRILSSFCSSTQYSIRFTNVYSIDVILHKLWLIFKLFFFSPFLPSPFRPSFHSIVVVTIAVLPSYTQTKWVKWKMENHHINEMRMEM